MTIGDDLPGHRRLLPSPCGAARLRWWREGRRAQAVLAAAFEAWGAPKGPPRQRRAAAGRSEHLRHRAPPPPGPARPRRGALRLHPLTQAHPGPAREPARHRRRPPALPHHPHHTVPQAMRPRCPTSEETAQLVGPSRSPFTLTPITTEKQGVADLTVADLRLRRPLRGPPRSPPVVSPRAVNDSTILSTPSRRLLRLDTVTDSNDPS